MFSLVSVGESEAPSLAQKNDEEKKHAGASKWKAINLSGIRGNIKCNSFVYHIFSLCLAFALLAKFKWNSFRCGMPGTKWPGENSLTFWQYLCNLNASCITVSAMPLCNIQFQCNLILSNFHFFFRPFWKRINPSQIGWMWLFFFLSILRKVFLFFCRLQPHQVTRHREEKREEKSHELMTQVISILVAVALRTVRKLHVCNKQFEFAMQTMKTKKKSDAKKHQQRPEEREE